MVSLPLPFLFTFLFKFFVVQISPYSLAVNRKKNFLLMFSNSQWVHLTSAEACGSSLSLSFAVVFPFLCIKVGHLCHLRSYNVVLGSFGFV